MTKHQFLKVVPGLILLLILSCPLSVAAQYEANQELIAAAVVPGAVLREGEVLAAFAVDAAETREILTRLDPGLAVGRVYRSLSRRAGMTVAHLRSETLSTQALLNILSRDERVIALSPNYGKRLLRTPNDPLWPRLWGLRRIGAQSAWDISTGSAEVVLAVIDTGTDLLHEDLLANLWTNSAEIPGNGIDDDGNGYVDDVHGYDFAPYPGADPSRPMDPDGHGTHVAGTIAAVGDNGRGVVGVNWNARIMTLKAFSEDGYIYDADSIEAIEYAVMMKENYGVNLVAINASYGGGPFNSLELKAIEAAGRAGIIFVAAAGNDSNDNDARPEYPAGYNLANVISVAAVNQNDQLASFSNFGTNSVHLAAPGQSILSTVPTGQGSESYVNQADRNLEARAMTYAPLTGISGITGLAVYCGLGLWSGDFPAQVQGNIALIRRGEIFFSEKVANARAAGAAGVIIFNNEPGLFSGTLGEPGAHLTTVSLSLEDGEFLLSIQPALVTLVYRPADYDYYQGTSMATPHVSGVLGLLAARHSSDNALERLSRLYSGAESLAGLRDKVVEGRLLNAENALRAPLVLTLQGSRESAAGWLLKKDYAALVMRRREEAPMQVERYVLNRKRPGSSFSQVAVIRGAEVVAGSHAFFDKFLETNVSYVYRIAAYDSQGRLLAVSNDLVL